MKFKFFVFLLPFIACAMEESCNTYQDEEITPANLARLAAPPKDVLERARRYVDAHKALVSCLVNPCRPSTYYSTFHRNVELLAHEGIKNKSRKDYIFQLPPDTQRPSRGSPAAHDYFVQITGPYSRIANSMIAQGKTVADIHAALGDFKKPRPALANVDHYPLRVTYHTVSRAAFYLRACEIIQNNNLETISVPATYIIPLDESPTVNDENAIVIQRALVEKCQVLDACEERKAQVPSHQMTDLLELIVYTGLWDLPANLLSADRDGHFFITDLEQPYTANPDHFFYQDQDEYETNVVDGISGVLDIFERQQEQLRIVDDYCEENVVFAHKKHQQELAKKIKQKVKQ